MGHGYYDKDGKPLELMERAEKFEDFDYKVIEQTMLDSGIKVSTVWLGMDHNFGDGEPLIFETMVFSAKESVSKAMRKPVKLQAFKYHEELDMERYSTLKDAIKGHSAMVAKWRDKKEDDIK